MKPAPGRGNFLIVLAALVALSGVAGIARADDAEVLPKGVKGLDIENKFYLPFDKSYKSDGGTQSAAWNLNGPLGGPGLGLPQGANIGDSIVSFRYKADELSVIGAYGLTDRLTIGVKIPYRWIQNDVNAELVSSPTSSATVGINTVYKLGIVPAIDNLPFVPLAGPTASVARRVTTAETQALISTGLILNGYKVGGLGFKPVTSWSGNGFLDIEVGGKYQYYKSDQWRLAFLGGVRLPTGKVDDPYNVVDVGFGSGAWAILLRSYNDYVGIENLVLNATLRYDIVLPDTETVRVTSLANPLQGTFTEVHRNQGDIFEAEATAKYTFFDKSTSCFLTYKYGKGYNDSVPDYPVLETQSGYIEQVIIGGLGFSTVPLYVEKKFFLPMKAAVSYRNRFAGTNNIFKTQYISLDVQVYF